MDINEEAQVALDETDTTTDFAWCGCDEGKKLLNDLLAAIEADEEKTKELLKLKEKQECRINDLEELLKKEQDLRKEMGEILHDMEARIGEEEERVVALNNENKKLQLNIQDLEEQLEEAGAATQKVQLERKRAHLEAKLKEIEEELSIVDDMNSKMAKEKKILEESNNDLGVALAEPETELN